MCVFLLQICSTDNCKARRWAWERGFLLTQGNQERDEPRPAKQLVELQGLVSGCCEACLLKAQKAPSPLPAWLFVVFFHCSPNANVLEGAPRSTIEACPLTWEEKQRAFKCYFPRKAQESDQTSAQMFLKCYPSFPQLLLAASTPLGLESRARAGCWPMAWQAVVSLLRRRRPRAAASWPGAQGGIATCINLSISHTPHQLSPSGTTRSYRILQVGKDH